MTLLMPNIAARVFNTPLLIDARKAMAMLAAIGGRIADGGIAIEGGVEAIEHIAFSGGRPSMGRLGDRLGRRLTMNAVEYPDVVSNIAVIPIEGTLVHKGGWIGTYSGETSYQGLQTQIAAAMRRPDIKGVVFEVDSFGGEASGAFETADMIAELSALKPTISILTDHALSAGYLLGSAARQVVMPAHGSAGSIGVVGLHVDMSAALEKEGLKVTLITAGAHKVDGNQFSALPKEVADRWRSSFEQKRQSFAAAVARYRGTRLSVERALGTEAQIYDGAEAVALGLADGTGNGNQIFDAFVREVNRR
jgi:ClpP class serine protease